MFWREVAPSRDLPIARCLSPLGHLFPRAEDVCVRSAAGLARRSLDPLPDTLAWATSDGPHACTSRGRRPRGEAGLAPASPSCSPAAAQTSLLIQKHPSPDGGTPGGPGPFLESHPGWHRPPWFLPPACPVVPKMLTCTIPHQTRRADPHQPTKGTRAERCSSQNPYQGAFLVERTENNKRQRNEPERDRKRVAGR